MGVVECFVRGCLVTVDCMFYQDFYREGFATIIRVPMLLRLVKRFGRFPPGRRRVALYVAGS